MLRHERHNNLRDCQRRDDGKHHAGAGLAI